MAGWYEYMKMMCPFCGFEFEKDSQSIYCPACSSMISDEVRLHESLDKMLAQSKNTHTGNEVKKSLQKTPQKPQHQRDSEDFVILKTTKAKPNRIPLIICSVVILLAIICYFAWQYFL